MTSAPTPPRTRRKAAVAAPDVAVSKADVSVPPASVPVNLAAKAAARKAAPAAIAAVEPAKAVKAAKADGMLKLKELVDQVTQAVGGKKKEVKDIVEATLTRMGLALDRGHSLNLPGLGKARIARPQATPGAVMTLKLRRLKAGAGDEKPSKETLAAANDQG